MVLADLSPDVVWKLIFVGFIAELSLIGVIAMVWGLFRLRRTHFRPEAYQRLLRGLLAWRLLEEDPEDPTSEYLDAEPLVIVWAHGQGLSAITSGAGMVGAGILASCAVLLVPLPARPATTWSAFRAVAQPLLVLLLVALQLLTVGMLGGLFLGYARAFRQHESNPHVAPMQPRLGIGAYRASWLLWLVLAMVALQSAVFALFVPAAFWHASTAQLVVFVLPAITIGEIVALEGVARAFCRMPLAQLPGPPETADQRRERVYAFLVTVIFSAQVAMLPLLAASQLLAWVTLSPSTALVLPASVGYAFLVETFGGLILIGLLGKTGGRLGGSSVGWPRRPAPSTESAMSRPQVDQAIGIGCWVLGFGITSVASARLHASWSLGAAAIPFSVLFVATLVLTIGNEVSKPIALYIGYLSLGCCMALPVVDRRHLPEYVVGPTRCATRYATSWKQG